MVYASVREGRRQLYVRALDHGDAVPLPGTDGASSPVFSPDGKDIAFVADGKLKRIATSGGVVTMVCNAPNFLGIAWGADGYIVFAPEVRSGLSRVPASGGTPEPITELDAQRNELSHRSPHVMDDGTILFAVKGVKDFDIDGLSPRTRERRTIVGNASFVQSAADRLVYVTTRGETFMARYDPSAMSVQGAPIALAERPSGPVGEWALALSRGGTLAYVPFERPRRLMAVAGRDGSLHTLAGEPKEYLTPRVSPDGQRIAVQINAGGGGGQDVWVFDLQSETLARLTTNRKSFQPVWGLDRNHADVRLGGGGEVEHPVAGS
jgi:serine/threonine-protein kinase